MVLLFVVIWFLVDSFSTGYQHFFHFSTRDHDLKLLSQDNSKPWTSKPFTKNNSVNNNKSKSVSRSHPRGQRRGNDPWWMREDEEGNPRMLPPYTPWWSDKVEIVDEKWKVNDLKREALRRGLSHLSKVNKTQLINEINRQTSLYDLSDSNMKTPTFRAHSLESLPPCYPQSYSAVK